MYSDGVPASGLPMTVSEVFITTVTARSANVLLSVFYNDMNAFLGVVRMGVSLSVDLCLIFLLRAVLFTLSAFLFLSHFDLHSFCCCLFLSFRAIFLSCDILQRYSLIRSAAVFAATLLTLSYVPLKRK